MNIIHLMGMRSSKYGGLERFQVELAKQLQLLGMRLILVYEQMPSSITFLRDLQAHKAEIIVLPCRSVKNIISFAFLTFCLFIKYRPLIVHFHFDPAGYIGLLSAKLLGVKTIRTVHSQLTFGSTKNICSSYFQLPLKSRFLKIFMYSGTDLILAVSEVIKNQFNSVFNKNNKIECLYLGVAPFSHDKTEMRNKYNLPLDKTIITCVAFHDPIKGIDILLEAALVLIQRYNMKDFIVCLVGGGSNTTQLQEKAKEMNIEDYIIWMGIHDRVPEILTASDIYVQPSRSEGISLALMEACFAKLPLIASNVGGIPEVVVHGSNGFLFEREDSAQLAEKINEILLNPEIALAFGDEGCKYANEHFNIYRQVHKLLEKYVQLSSNLRPYK